MRIIGAALLALAVSAAALPAEERPETGLLWRQGDLPAIFPLQVKTLPGKDYFLLLVEVETGTNRLAAYLRGGEFFRVLVPPGRYALHIAYGSDWLGEAQLFGDGPAAGSMILRDPLSFEVKGLGRKSGHIVDLRGGTHASPALAGREDWALCQSLRLDPESLLWIPSAWPVPRFERDGSSLRPVLPQDLPPPVPRYDVVARFCR